MRRVPPPPTTKRTGTSVSKPTAPRLAPPPPQVVLSNQDQSSGQAETVIANQQNVQKIQTTSNTNQIKQNEVNETKRNEKFNIPQSEAELSDQTNFKVQSQELRQQQNEQKAFEAPKVPSVKKPIKPPQGARKPVGPPKIAPPKVIEKPQIISELQQTAIPSPVQENQKQSLNANLNQEKETATLTQSQNFTKTQNTETDLLTQKEQTPEEISLVVEQPKQPKKFAPPPAAKKQTGPKVPPPTKKLPGPPKPVQAKIEQTPLQQNSNEQKFQSSEQIKESVQTNEMPQKALEQKTQVQNLPQKIFVPPSVKKSPLVSPKKPELKSPVKPIHKQYEQNLESSVISNQVPLFKTTKPQLSTKPQTFQQTSISPLQSSPSAYNQLQQKLRMLQMMRSRIDQSSQESYSNKNDDIEEEQEEVQFEGQKEEEQEEENKEFIHIVGQRDVNLREEELFEDHIPSKNEEFVIGQTNYDEMEIKDYHEEETFNEQAKPATLFPNPFSNQLTELSSSQNEQDSLVPAPADTIVESNMSVEQTQHQYLPDEVSISPVDSQGSTTRHHLIHQHQSSLNNVVHADKYHSQANFSHVQDKKITVKNEITDNSKEVEKSDGELVRLTHEQKDNKMEVKVRDQSLQVNRDEYSYVTQRPEEIKQNGKHPSNNERKIKSSDHSNVTYSINQLLQQFTIQKSQYERNYEKLKRSEEKFRKQELSYQQRIQQLLQEVNHKNLLLLKYTNSVPFDRSQNSDRLKEVEEL